ncbi:MAG: PQQ-dependent sugar dehydrogenase, partial [Ketobacter sp.]|nr:PQQ-dependent sugar dehydrogenase [Ketobacter sp.]
MKPLLTMLLGLLLTPLLWAVESQQANFRVEVIARNLDHPWGLAFLDSEQLLVTERSGQLRLVKQ